MKKYFKKTFWLLKQSKGSRLLLFLIISIGMLSSLLDVYRAILMKNLIDAATTGKLSTLTYSILLLGFLIILTISLSMLSSRLNVRCTNRINNHVQKSKYDSLMRTNMSDFSKYSSGDILTRMTSDIDNVTSLHVSIIPNIISLSILILSSFFTLLQYDYLLSILILFMSPIPLIMTRLFSGKLKKLYIKSQEIEGVYKLFLNESIQNISIVKSFCLEKYNMNKLNQIHEDRYNLALKRNKISIFSNSLLSIASWFGIFITFSFGAYRLSLNQITFGTITAMIQLVGNIQGPFYSLAYSLPQIISAYASQERLYEIETLQLDCYDEIASDYINSNNISIDIKNLSYSYNDIDYVLNNVSTTINSGETVALIGKSGEGKTTLIKLLLSFYQSNLGAININSLEKSFKVNASSRNFISYVPQGNTLFSGSISDNLRFGNLNATDLELKSVLASTCCLDFINKLENGVDTIIGEHGLGLSEGQAQRLAIARALLRKSPILILDEATSALDEETEVAILKTIANLDPTPICIIITHRPTSLKICDRVLKITNKELVEISNQYANNAESILN